MSLLRVVSADEVLFNFDFFYMNQITFGQIFVFGGNIKLQKLIQ